MTPDQVATARRLGDTPRERHCDKHHDTFGLPRNERKGDRTHDRSSPRRRTSERHQQHDHRHSTSPRRTTEVAQGSRVHRASATVAQGHTLRDPNKDLTYSTREEWQSMIPTPPRSSKGPRCASSAAAARRPGTAHSIASGSTWVGPC